MDENKKAVMFRGAVAGYSKKDVNKYLEQISGDFTRLQEETEERVSRIKRELYEEKSMNAELSEKLDELACEAYSASVKEQENTALRRKIAELEFKLDEMACEAYSAQEREAEIKAAAIGLSARISEYENSKTGEEISEELLSSVNEKIDGMLASAQKRGEEIISRSRDEADEIRSKAEFEAQSIRDKIKAIYKDSATEYYDEVLQFADEIKGALTSFVRDINAKSGELNGKIDYMRLESENAARASGVVVGTASEKSAQASAGTEKIKPVTEKKPMSTLEALSEKIDGFFKNALLEISIMKDKK